MRVLRQIPAVAPYPGSQQQAAYDSWLGHCHRCSACQAERPCEIRAAWWQIYLDAQAQQ